MKEIVYPQRLRETIVGKGDLSYIRTAHHGAPPPPPPSITCIPTNYTFTDDLMNFDLVSTVDVMYQFYTIIETSDGKRFFLRIEDNVIPMNSVTVNVYDDNEQLVPMRLTAAAVITEILGGSSTSISGFNEPFYSSHLNAEFVQIIQNLVYRCDIGMLKLGPGEEFYNIIINSISGLTLDSPIPDFFMEIGNMENLRFIKESYTFKFARATLDDIERYGIVNNGSRRTINIIDYINGGDEIVLQSCARIELLIDSNPNPDPDPTPLDPPPVINCIPTSFNVTQIQGDTTKTGGVIAVASIWYEGKEYPYITTADQMAYLIPNVTSAKLRFGGGFRTGILMHHDAYNAYPEYCKALVIARYTADNYFVAGASNDNLVAYMKTASIWDGGDGAYRIFKSETMKAINEPSEIRLTRLSPEMSEFIKTYGGDAAVFLNGNYNVNNLVDMVNQGNDIIINACVKVESNMFDEQPEEPPVEPEPPVISCTPTVFNMTQIQGAATTGGYAVVGASIWYEGQEYPYIIVAEPMELSAYDVNRTKLNLGAGFRKGITAYYDAYNVYPEYCKALVITRNTNDNYFIAGAGTNNLEMYVRTPDIWDGGGPDRIFNPDTMQVVNEPSQIRLTKLSPEMTQFIKTHGGYASDFLNGDYYVNNLVDIINQGNDITINACVKVESNLLPTPSEEPPEVTTPPTPAMAIVNMISDTPFISTFKNGFELESYYDAEAGGYRIENENNKIYLRDPAYAPVVSFRPKQGNLMGATQIQGEAYDWQGIGFDINLATPKHLNKIQNIYGFPSNDVVLVMLSQLNEEQSAPPILNGRFVCNPEIE